MRQPTIYIPHGAGPCFFMDWPFGPKDMFYELEAFLRQLPTLAPEPPRAVLTVSAHWEADVATVSSGAKPPMFYDYEGFPPHTYELKWPAPGSPEIARRIHDLLSKAGIDTQQDPGRGFDHGTFVPMLLAWPDANIPTVQLSIRRDFEQARLPSERGRRWRGGRRIGDSISLRSRYYGLPDATKRRLSGDPRHPTQVLG